MAGGQGAKAPDPWHGRAEQAWGAGHGLPLTSAAPQASPGRAHGSPGGLPAGGAAAAHRPPLVPIAGAWGQESPPSGRVARRRAPGSSSAQQTGTETPRNRPGTARAPGGTGLLHGPPHARPWHHLAAAWMEDRAVPAHPKAPCSPSGTTTSTVAPAAETPPCPRCGGSGYGLGPRSSQQLPRQLASG